MSKDKVGIRAQTQAEKEVLRAEINELQSKITAARNASRVPDRVVNGDANTAARWKDDLESCSGLYHANNPVKKKCTADYLRQIKQRLEGILLSIQ